MAGRAASQKPARQQAAYVVRKATPPKIKTLMLDQERNEILDSRQSRVNLRQSLFSLGLLILADISFFLALDSFGPGQNKMTPIVLTFTFYGLMTISAILASVTIKNCATVAKKSKNNRNYIALGICVLVLLSIAAEIFNRLL